MKKKEIIKLVFGLILVTIVTKWWSLAAACYLQSIDLVSSLKRVDHVFTNSSQSRDPTTPPIIAYAVTVTKCLDLASPVLEGSAIVAELVHDVSIQNVESGSKYDYQLYAFLNNDEKSVSNDCEIIMGRLGYTTLRKPLPVNLSAIQSREYLEALGSNGCCGASEFLKLWSYTLTDHPAVVHLDLDVLILKPLDDLFDTLILDPSSRREQFDRLHVMRDKQEFATKSIHAFITRDYMQIQQQNRWERYNNVPVQGGFFVIRPSNREFKRIRETVLTFGENYTSRRAWGDDMWGHYWGMPQIQGLLAFYYTRQSPNSAVELHNCYYNTILGISRYDDKCMNGMPECEDCRGTAIQDIHVAHPIFCGKVYQCQRWNNPKLARTRLCRHFFHTWASTRRKLEERWTRAGMYYNKAGYEIVRNKEIAHDAYCLENKSYIPMTFTLL